MVRGSRRMALYEVIGKSELKSAQGKELGRLKSNDPAPKLPVDTGLKKTGDLPVKDAKPWQNKPKWLRFYSNRIEFSLSWPVAVITVLAIFAIFLVFFRLGRINAGKNADNLSETASERTARPLASVKAPAMSATEAATLVRPATPKMVEPMGDHVIVIASYDHASHLEPVKSYFAGFGIETNVIMRNGRYLLVTQQRYENPERADSDGNIAMQKIIKIGAGYKPPKSSGYESFAPKLFSDAYGMKIK